MCYPKFWKKTVDILGLTAGALTLVIAVLSVMEAISRYAFRSPNSWTLSLSTYILIYIVFLASPFAFQEGGHVAVDMVRIACDRFDKSGRLRHVIAVIGFCFALLFIYVLEKGSYTLFSKALASHKATLTVPIIPLWALYLPMVVGLILMAITLVFMILDIIAKNGTGKYL